VRHKIATWQTRMRRHDGGPGLGLVQLLFLSPAKCFLF
jgi:hypothetical protein